MADILKSNLEQLHELLTINDASRTIQATTVVQDIFNHTLDVSHSESTYISSLLFNEKSGILKFLKQAVNLKEFESAKCDIFRFLAEYVKQDDFKSNFQHAKLIKDACVSCYTIDQSNRVKCECTNVLYQLLMLDCDGMEKELDIKKLFERFWSECLNVSRTTSGKAGLKCYMYNLMGGFCEMYPHIAGSQSDRILSLYLGSLKQEMTVKKSKVELQVITGCFRGLTGYLVNFTQSVSEGSKYANDIFKYVKLCIMSQDYNRYDAPKAALNLLKMHCSQFKELITEQAEQIYEALQKWSQHINREIKYLAIETTDEVLIQISTCVSADGNTTQNQGVLRSFMMKFHTTLNSSTVTAKEVLIAVKGYGKFAGACSKVFKANEMKMMFEEILKRSEQSYSCLDTSQDDSFYQLPTYLEALASIIKYLNEVPTSYLFPLEKIVISLFDFYPHLGSKGQDIYHKSFTSFIEALSSFPAVFKTCLSQIVYQCLIRTCSHPLHMEKLLEESEDIEGHKKLRVSYKTFLPIWKSLLDSKSYKVSVYDSNENENNIKEQVFDELMQSLLFILEKLNLKTEQGDVEKDDGEVKKEVSSKELVTEEDDVEKNELKAVVPNDFTILVNLVDYCKDVLTGFSVMSFTRWMAVFVEKLILYSTRNPMISGFYKLLQVMSHIIQKTEYLANYSVDSKDIPKEKYTVYVLLISFMKEVGPRIKQYSGDLLISCIEFMITLPIEIIKSSIHLLIQPLKIAFEIGLSHYELAELGLTTLEKLNTHLTKHETDVILTNVLPCLDDYLQSVNEEKEEQQEKIVRTKSERKMKRTSVRYLKALINASKQTVESPLTKLKLRIVDFLGKLGGASNISILHNSAMETLTKAIVWDTEKQLMFSLPFQDVKPAIYLDSYLVRVVELALTSSNRQTKVVACEFLHALVLYMLGVSVSKTYERNKSESSGMTKLYIKVFPAIIKLACSVEQVAEQLFRPLVFQIIHWLTGNNKYESPETIALLDSLLEGVTSSTDSSLREFSALCVKEFLHWSIKQTSLKKLEENPVNPKSLFKRLHSLALHANIYKRLGAAIVMNNIYSVFREESTLVDVFVLDLLVLFIKSLSLAHTDEKTTGTVSECEKVLQHLERIIVKKGPMLCKTNKNRKKPAYFKNTTDFSLHHINIWILRVCGTSQTAARHACMKLVHAFTPLQKGHYNLKTWMANTLETNGAKYISDKFEKGNLANQGIRHYTTLKDRVEHKFSIATTIDWLENFLGALDSYCWVFSTNLITPTQLLVENPDSKVLESTADFINNMALVDLHGICEQYDYNDIITPSQNEQFSRVKCTVIVRTLNFLSLSMAKGLWRENKILDTTLHFHKKLYSILFSCMFTPQLIGFNITDNEVLLNLPKEIAQFINIFNGYATDDLKQAFQTFISSKLSHKDFDILHYLPLDLMKSLQLEQHSQISLAQVASGYLLLCEMKLLDGILSNEKCIYLANEIATTLSNSITPLLDGDTMSINPTQKLLADKFLQLALNLDVKSVKIIELLIDGQPSKNERVASSNESCGCIFYHLFADVFNDHFMEHSNTVNYLIEYGARNSKALCTILSRILKAISKKNTGDANNSNIEKICKEVLLKWSLFSGLTNSNETVSLCLQLANSLLALSKDCLQYNDFFMIFPCVLNNSNVALATKEAIIDTLPVILSKCNDKQTNMLKEALHNVIINHFPIKSTDLKIGTSRYISYMTCLNKFMKSMVASSNTMIFNVLISVIVRETQDVYEKVIESSLVAFVQSLNSKNIEDVFGYCFKLFEDHNSYTIDMRENIIQRVCLPTLHTLNTIHLKEFYQNNIKKLMAIVEAKLIKTNEQLLENQLLDSICAFKILSLLFELLDKDVVATVTSDIVKAYYANPVTGKELTSSLSRIASTVFKEDMRGESMCLELRRQYHCAAYNCLVAIISCTQTSLKFYTGLLFADNPAKGSLMFENLIDTKKTYLFECELTTMFTRKKTLQLIRKAHDGSFTNENSTQKTKGFAGYLSSQYLMGSSFSQDVSQFDFNSPIEAYSSYAANPSNEDSYNRMTDDAPDSPTADNIPTVIELDALNQHECMTTFIGVITHMKSNKIYLLPSNNQDEMPPWMTFLHKKMCSRETELNVKLFICKLVNNIPKIFEPYGKHWFQPLTDLILSNQIQGSPLNYFVMDIIVVMLSWSKTVIPENNVTGCNLSSSLLDYTLKYCHHTNRSILKNNLQIIKTLLNVWKERLEISYGIVYDLFKNANNQTKDNATGLQLLGLILSAGFKPFSPQAGLSANVYYQDLSRNLTYKYKEVYATAAEVCSVALKYNAENQIHNEFLTDTVNNYLISFSKSMKDRFVICLYSMHLHYPVVVDRYVSQLLYCLLSLYGILKTQCLQCLASRIDHLTDHHGNIYQQIKGKEIKSLLTHVEEDTQMAALQLIMGMATSLQEVDILHIIAHVASLRTSSSIKLRELMYDFFIWVYDEQSKDGKMESEESFEILRASKECLLLGINDANTSLSLKLLNFWRNESHLPTSTIERLIEILRALYSSKTEKEFLSFSTNLMLQLTSLSPDYSLPLFNAGLDSEDSFRNYHINFSWQRHNIAMTPLFVATQDSSSQSSSSQSYGNRMLRATQRENEFTQTMEVDPSFNWMNPSVQITPQSFTPTPSSLNSSLIGAQPLSLNKTLDSVDGKGENTFEILKLKKRFLKDKYSKNLHFASMQIKKNKMRKAEKDRQIASRDRKVVMYRKYRSGELPDIKIKHSELIVPLQALSQLDNQIAKMLFSDLFTAIITTFPEKFTEDVMEKAFTDIQDAVDVMMKSTTLYHPTFINAILEICYNNKQLKLDAQHISANSIISMQQPMGVLLLEKQLLNNTDIISKRKQSRVMKRPEDLSSWLELAKVYDSINDYDLLRCIFTHHISKVDVTKQALAAEARNDYDTALSLYREASRKEDWEDSPTEVEEDYWDTARLRCYENLSMWSNLRDFTTQSMTDEGETLDVLKIWQDEELQDVYLPYYMKCNMKLLCQGKLDMMHQDFTSFIEESLKDGDAKEHLQARYSDELALLNAFQDNYGTAQHYLNISIRSFLDEWSHLNKLVTTNRQTNLLRLQKVTEIGEFVHLMLNNEYKDEVKVRSLLDTWTGRLLDKNLHSTTVWDDIILNRCAFIRKLKSNHYEERELLDSLDVAETKNILLIADVARKQSNFAVANQYLRDSSGIFAKTNDDSTQSQHDLMLQWRHVYVKVHCDKVKLNYRDAKTNLSALISSVDHLSQCREHALLNDETTLKQYLLEFQTWNSITSVMKSTDEVTRGNTLSLLSKLDSMKEYTHDVDTCIEQLHSHSLYAINMALAKTNELSSGVQESVKLRSKVLMKMVVYCDERIKEKDDEATSENNGLADIIIRNLLQAMKLNSSEARLRFPRLLQLIDIYPDTRELFAKQCIDVPPWMYLSWVNQIIALLDKPTQSCVYPILNQIARSYPQAIMYPLKVCSEQLQFDFTLDGKKRKKYFDNLLEHVSEDVSDSLAFALGQLTNPNHILKDFLKEAKSLFDKKDSRRLMLLYKEFHNKLLGGSNPDDKSQSTPPPGRFAKEFQKEYNKEFDTSFGKGGKKLIGMNEKDFLLAHGKMVKISSKITNKLYNGNLKDFSPWLSAFQSSNYQVTLEIPGQYSGDCKPMLEYHVNITGFDEKIQIMSSLRKPKRLTIRGDDEKDYKFLVKGGEDLRQDQRIEQIFELMNAILKKDSLCSKKILELKTYNVIPMTNRVGIIEWLDNTAVYSGVLTNELDIREKKSFNEMGVKYQRHLQNFGVKDSKSYAPIYNKKLKREAIVSSFTDVVNMVPWDLLRRVFASYALSSEAYFLLRRHFVQSHSCLCISQYILGIGDRHLNNLLIDTTNGGVVGIDFGHAFGTATQMLRIPELMPFRLTSQMLNLLLPVQGASPYKESMVAVLNAYRKNAGILLNTMDIFITEPLIEWEAYAKLQANVLSQSLDQEDTTTWYPKHKINICRHKLLGVNSAHIMAEELNAAQSKNKAIEGFLTVAKGDAQHNIRKRLLDISDTPETYLLTTEEQVDCLVDHATDPSVLGRTWNGWNSWV